MRVIPPREWVDLPATVAFEGPVTVDHPHPALHGSPVCVFDSIDYDPFEDVLELQVSTRGALLRILVDDPQEIRLQPGETLEVISGATVIAVHALHSADREQQVPGRERQQDRTEA